MRRQNPCQTIKMVLTKSDKNVIETLFKEKGWRGRRIVREFPTKNWTQVSVDRHIRKIIKLEAVIVLKAVVIQGRQEQKRILKRSVS